MSTVPSLFAPAPGHRSLANSLPGTFAPLPFRSLAFSLPGLLALWNFRSLALSLPGLFANVPGSEYGYPAEVGALFTTVSSIRVSRANRVSRVRVTLTVTVRVSRVSVTVSVRDSVK